MKNNQNHFHFVLHAHLPFVVGTEVEFWLYEAAINSYIPFINMISRISEKTHLTKITLNISPVLLLQLGAEEFSRNLEQYINTRRRILSIDLEDFQKNKARIESLENLEKTLSEFKIYHSIIDAFQKLSQKGVLNIVTSAFTHPLLPTFKEFPNLINMQLTLGKQISEYYFGTMQGFWSPECAVYPELSSVLKKHHLQYSFIDPAATSAEYENSLLKDAHLYYFVRDRDATDCIWDADKGYPGHSLYQDFYADYSKESPKIKELLTEQGYPQAGFSIRAVTDKTSEQKDLYSHKLALEQAHQHADEYLHYLQTRFHDRRNTTLSVFFDMELFGHWWKDGIAFLEAFFLNVNRRQFELNFSISMPECSSEINFSSPKLSTWGLGSSFESWINEKTKDLWVSILQESVSLESEWNKVGIDRLLNYFLIQASDWTFLITYQSFEDFSKQQILSKDQRSKQVSTLKKYLDAISVEI